MQIDKAPNLYPLSVVVSRILKTTGVVITLVTLLNILIVVIPYQLGNLQWQVNFTSQAVDRGFLLLLGLALFLSGYWVDGAAGLGTTRKNIWQDPKFWALALASLFGLLFLLLFPLHLNNVRLGHEQAMQQIDQQTKQAQTQLSERLNTEISSRRQQINQLLTATDDQLKQLTDLGQLTKEQADLVTKFKKDPKSIDPFLQKQADELKTKLQGQIDGNRKQAEELAKTESLKSGLRIGINSLILAIGFIFVGWSGLRNLR